MGKDKEAESVVVSEVEKLFKDSVRTVSEFLHNTLISKEDIQKARIASSAMSMYQRFRSTLNSEMSMKYRIAKDLSKDKAELEKYISITTPELMKKN